MAKTFHITLHGRRELEEELAQLTAFRKEISSRIADAKAYGDLSENAEYSAARDEQNVNESRIAEIENILQNAKIIKSNRRSQVCLGSVVVLENGARTEYRIVGAVEADPGDGKISNESPLGIELMGKKAGDKVTVETARGDVVYTIKSIS